MPIFKLTFDNDPQVTYREHAAGSPKEYFDGDGAGATRILEVNWEQRLRAARAILGYATAVSYADGSNSLRRYLPMAHPDIVDGGGAAYVFATRVATEGLQAQIKTPQPSAGQYTLARLTVTHQTLPYDVLSDAQMLAANFTRSANNGGGAIQVPDESSLRRYVTLRGQPAAEYFTCPTGTFKYVLPSTPPVVFGLGKMLIHQALPVTWHGIVRRYVPCAFINQSLNPGTGFIEQALGRVNSAPFANCKAGTLLLMAAEIKPVRNTLGERIFDITYIFKFFMPTATAGHNWVFKPGPPAPPAWVEVTTDGATNLLTQTPEKNVYDWFDFTKLFQPQIGPNANAFN